MTPERIALKRATAELLRGVGGLEAAAGFCRVGKSQLGDYQNAAEPKSFMPIDVVADLEPLARDREGWPHVTRRLCTMLGGVFVELPQVAPDTATLIELLGRHSKEGGEAAEATCLAASSDAPALAARAVKELDDLIAATMALRAAMAAKAGVK